jgi:hypothetical protein
MQLEKGILNMKIQLEQRLDQASEQQRKLQTKFDLYPDLRRDVMRILSSRESQIASFQVGYERFTSNIQDQQKTFVNQQE